MEKAFLKNFVSVHWSDEKIKNVMAFIKDHGMLASSICNCFIGVHSSEKAHVAARCPDMVRYALGQSWESVMAAHHYHKARAVDVEVCAAESVYMRLASLYTQAALDRLFYNLLEDVLKERAAAAVESDLIPAIAG